MGTKKEELESTTGCLAKAADDEPIFVLRAQDTTAPNAVRAWVSGVIDQHRPLPGAVLAYDPKLNAKLKEALNLADRMEAWQREHGCKVPD